MRAKIGAGRESFLPFFFFRVRAFSIPRSRSLEQATLKVIEGELNLEMGCFLMLQNPGLARYCGEAWVFSERALSVLSNAIITWACFCSTENITAA